MDDKKATAVIEGILFAMGDSVSPAELAQATGLPEKEVGRLTEELAEALVKEDRGIRIIRVNGSYQMCTSKDIYESLIRLAKQPKKYTLTNVLLETLSIIAYKQPVTKAEIEKIRGVSSDHAVNKLVEYNLVKELGRLDAPGRPVLFGTTDDFLRAFGIESIEDLPVLNPARVEEFKEEAEEEAEEQFLSNDGKTVKNE